MITIDPSSCVASCAVVTGDVRIGPGSRVLHDAVLNGDLGPIHIGSNVLVMENAVLRGRANTPLTIGGAVLVGPPAHLNAATVEDEVFIVTGVSVFAGTARQHRKRTAHQQRPARQQRAARKDCRADRVDRGRRPGPAVLTGRPARGVVSDPTDA